MCDRHRGDAAAAETLNDIYSELNVTVLRLQFVDDILDFTGNTLQLGKPALNDLRSGLATAPVIFAAEEHPQVDCSLIKRKSEPLSTHSLHSLRDSYEKSSI